MLLAGTKTDVEAFGWRHLCEMLADSEISDIVESGLTEREHRLIDYCIRIAYSFDHDGSEPAYRGSGANIAASLSNKLFGSRYDYGSPYTSHDECQCPTCRAVRSNNAKHGWPTCQQCGRLDDKHTSRLLSDPPWVCEQCLSKTA